MRGTQGLSFCKITVEILLKDGRNWSMGSLWLRWTIRTLKWNQHFYAQKNAHAPRSCLTSCGLDHIGMLLKRRSCKLWTAPERGIRLLVNIEESSSMVQLQVCLLVTIKLHILRWVRQAQRLMQVAPRYTTQELSSIWLISKRNIAVQVFARKHSSFRFLI